MDGDKPWPEVGSSGDPKAVPWHDAVVWTVTGADGRRAYEWLSKQHVRGVSWTSGVVSVQVHDDSFLARDVQYIILQAPFVSVGRNIHV